MVDKSRLELDEEVGQLAVAARLLDRERIVRRERLGHEILRELREGGDLRHVGADDDVPHIDPFTKSGVREFRIDVDVDHDGFPSGERTPPG